MSTDVETRKLCLANAALREISKGICTCEGVGACLGSCPSGLAAAALQVSSDEVAEERMATLDPRSWLTEENIASAPLAWVWFGCMCSIYHCAEVRAENLNKRVEELTRLYKGLVK